MEVTNVHLTMLDGTGARAIGNFSLDNEFVVRGIRIMEGPHGKEFVSFPSRKKKDGEYEEVAFPVTKEFYQKLTEAILKEYQDLKAKEEQTEGQDLGQTETAEAEKSQTEAQDQETQEAAQEEQESQKSAPKRRHAR
jgi:DNA-binding cell septation regulator SpoVG